MDTNEVRVEQDVTTVILSRADRRTPAPSSGNQCPTVIIFIPSGPPVPNPLKALDLWNHRTG